MKKLSCILTVMLLLLGGVGLTSCDLFFVDNPMSPRLKVESSAMTLEVGQTKPCNASASTKAKLLYGSSDEAIAKVDANGLVTGVAKGTAYITVVATNADNSALFFDESAIITVTVVGPSEEEKKAEAIELLDDAQKAGALVSMYFTLDNQDYVAIFKLIDGEYVLQEPASTRTVVQWTNKGNLKTKLKLVDVSSMGTNTSTLLLFSVVDHTTGKTLLECMVDTQNASCAVVSDDKCVFGGMVVDTEPVTLTEETLEEVLGDTPSRVIDGTVEVWDGNDWLDPMKDDKEDLPMIVMAKGYTGTYDGEAHGITVDAPEGATIKYGTTEGFYDLTASPTYTDAGTYTVYYTAMKTGYITETGSTTVTINKAAMTVTATGFSGTYDGKAHGITVNAPTGATVKYGTAAGSYTLTTSPTFTNASTNTVYYEVTKDNFNTVTGSATVTINKVAGTIIFSSATLEKLNSDSAFDYAATKTGDGTISGYSSSAPGVATVDANGRVTISSAGTTIITVTVADGTNYKYTPNTATYTLTVKPGGLNGPSTYDGGENPF